MEIRLEAHPHVGTAAHWLKDFIARSGLAPELARVSVALDPMGVLAATGTLEESATAEFAGCLLQLRTAGLRGALLSIDASVYHEAGASEAQELAVLLASAVWWVDMLAREGLAPADVLPLLEAGISVDCVQFISLGKLRALPLLFGRLQEAYGLTAGPVRVHVQTSRRMLTRSDQANNRLRNTIAAFVGAVGGADSITVHPHTYPVALPDRSARALARNLQRLIMEESHLYAVADPAAGSGAIEAVTETLAELAWNKFQEIEREGGMMKSLTAGLFQDRVRRAREQLKTDIKSGARTLVDLTSRHADLEQLHSLEVISSREGAVLAPVRLEELAA
jgi:methylmalonyl-CoA mutase